jgi:hypothetical protein
VLDLGEEARLDDNVLVKLKACIAEVTENGRLDSLHEDMQEAALAHGLPLNNDH